MCCQVDARGSQVWERGSSCRQVRYPAMTPVLGRPPWATLSRGCPFHPTLPIHCLSRAEPSRPSSRGLGSGRCPSGQQRTEHRGAWWLRAHTCIRLPGFRALTHLPSSQTLGGPTVLHQRLSENSNRTHLTRCFEGSRVAAHRKQCIVIISFRDKARI